MTVVDLYTVQLISVPVSEDDRPYYDGMHARAVEAIMAETEENLTDLLPAGYRARIRRWDHPDPDEGNDDE